MNTESRFPARPIFLIGAPRSGTTMLRYMLCAHPRLYIPPESNFIPRLAHYGPDRPLSRPEALALVEKIIGYKVFFRDWQGERPDPAAFVDALSDRRLPALLDGLYRAYAARHGAERWGDKSPIYTSYVNQIAGLFPEAQFIHIVRDGRDVTLSMLKAYQGRRFFYVDLGYAALSWKQRVQRARAAGRRLGHERYLELRYEELTAEPEGQIRRVCDFLGEAYEAAMVDPGRVAEKSFHSRGIHAATRGKVTVNKTGRWAQEMTPGDQRIFHALAGDLLDELAYEAAPIGRLNWRERLRLVRLIGKYAAVETSRRTLQKIGVFHPASLLARRR